MHKLYPALFKLHAQQLLAEETIISVFGKDRRERDQFLDTVLAGIRAADPKSAPEPSQWSQFISRLSYCSGDATQADELGAIPAASSPLPLVVYLATPATIFAPVCEAINKAGLVREDSRIVVEKPLGDSGDSFAAINDKLFGVFAEHQVYRIDHYLGKEPVQNLLALRFANTLFEPLWNRHYIDHVQITVAESIGVGGRWPFYEQAGALRDMVQSHLLQLLCLVSMEVPAKNSPTDVRGEKVKVLRSLKPITADNVQSLTVRGQYIAGALQQQLVCGYLEEEDAGPHGSGTETFVALKAQIENNRWHGVPFYLRTGKRLPQRISEIAIQFKPVVHQLFAAGNRRELPNNRLIIRLQPNEGVEMHIMNKVPGLSLGVGIQQLALNLSFDTAFDNYRSPDAYERLLLDVACADQTLFVRSDEIASAWRWIDGIIGGWAEVGQAALPYAAGSWGPADALALIIRDQRNWLDYPDTAASNR